MAVDFHGFLGHGEIVALIRSLAAGVRRRKKAYPHTLLVGRSGLGKTKLAQATAMEMETNLHFILGRPDVSVVTIGLAAAKWESGDVFFLDEAHSLTRAVQEACYRIMTESTAPRVIEFNNRRIVDGEVKIPPITIIAATNLPGKLLPAFRARFQETHILSRYDLDDIVNITRRVAAERKIGITPQAARAVAERCQGVPRHAVHFVEGIANYCGTVAGAAALSVADVMQYFEAEGIDSFGRSPTQQRYMELLGDGNPKSLETLSSILGPDCEYVKETIEEWLIAKGWVTIGQSGRRLTANGLGIAHGTMYAGVTI